MINWTRIDELKQDIGEDSFNEILEIFVDEMESRLRMLVDGDSASLQDDLHFLKGSAANLGFDTFHKKCEDLERTGDYSQVGILAKIYATSKQSLLSNANPVCSV